MITDKLAKSIKDQISLGKSEEEIKQFLASEGWSYSDIEIAISDIKGLPPVLTLPIRAKSSKLVIVLFMILMVLGIAYYIFMINRSESSRTFTNYSNTFSVDYSGKWALSTLKDHEWETVITLDTDDNYSDKTKNIITYSISTIKQWEEDKKAFLSNDSNVSFKEIMFNNNNFLEYSYPSLSSKNYYMITPLDDNFLIQISIIVPEEIPYETLNFILSNIKVYPENTDNIIDEIKIAKIRGDDAKIKAILSTFRVSAEIYFSKNNSYTGLCLSQHVVEGTREIETTSSESVYCNDVLGSSYIIGSRLNDGIYYCIDNSGFSGTTTNIIGRNNCK